jgi:hypothetical protein
VILTHRNILASSSGLVKGALPDCTIFIRPEDRFATTTSTTTYLPYPRPFATWHPLHSPNPLPRPSPSHDPEVISPFVPECTSLIVYVLIPNHAWRRYISYLPMAHSFEICMQICIIIAGNCYAKMVSRLCEVRIPGRSTNISVSEYETLGFSFALALMPSVLLHHHLFLS